MTHTADLIVHHADLPTVDAVGRLAGPDAVAVTGGRIVEVGTWEDLRRLAGPSTQTVDAAGGALLPGINDAHLHFSVLSSILFNCVDISASRCSSWTEVAETIRQAAALRPPVVRAHGWDDFRLGPGGTDMMADLDIDVPVIAFDQTGHQLLANEALIRQAEVSDRTPDPEGGRIGRRCDGTPDGLFVDAAMELIIRHTPQPTATALRNVQLEGQRLLHSLGITSLTDPGLGPGGAGLLDGSPNTSALDSLIDLAEHDELTMRVNVLLLFAGTGGITADVVQTGLVSSLPSALEERNIDPLQLRIGGVKVFADGTPRSGTAWMSAPYGSECSRGHLVVGGADNEERLQELGELIRLIHESGLQAGVHATGDATTSAVIDAIAAAQAIGAPELRAGASRDPRHYVIHGAFNGAEAPAELARMAEHGVGYCTNPLIRYQGGASLEHLLGPHRFAWHQPLASAMRAGVNVTATSDAPVTSPDWRGEIVAMATRTTRDHPTSVNPAECLDSRSALATMTSMAAWQDRAEHDKGFLTPGHLADFCLLGDPWPTESSIDSLLSNPVTKTWIGGRLVYEST